MKRKFPTSIVISILLVLSAFTFALAASANGLLQPYVVFSIEESAEAVGIGDFNHDGLNDAAITTFEGNLLIYTQNVSGGLNSPNIYPAGLRPESLAVGDLNNDGWDDIVANNFSSDTISVFLQQSNGTFASRVIYTASNGPDSVAVGDLNNDGRDDVVVSHWLEGNIGVFTQNENGTLNAKVIYSSPTAGYDDIAIGDVNNDGLNDVIKMNGQIYANPDLSVYLQNGSGTLNTATSYSLPGNVVGRGIGIGDVTGDGQQDVVMSYGSFVAVFAQASDGSTLQAPISYNSYNIPQTVEMADLNLDGLTDVIALHGGWERISIYPQESNGSLGSYALYPIPYATNYNPQGLAIGDINQDNLPDVLIADYNAGLVVLYHEPVTPAPFNKVSPANGAVNQSLTPTLSWAASNRATSYEYCYDTINNNDCDTIWSSAGGATNTNLGSLASGTIYYWQVRAINDYGVTYANGDIANWRSFTTGIPPSSFNKSTPSNGSVDQLTSLSISWETAVGATTYEYCYDTINNNICDEAWESVGANTSINLSGLSGNTNYYWHVRALNSFGSTYANGSSENWWSLLTEDTSTPTDVLLSNSSIIENQPVGSIVGVLTTVDANLGDIFTYSLVDGQGSIDNASFTISGNMLKTKAIFNYNVQSLYFLRIRSTDQDGLYIEEPFTISVIKQTNTFGDVPNTYWAWQYVERLYHAGVTSGCNQNPLIFCPENPVTRAQMAVFLLKAKYGPSYAPPPAGSSTGFNDTPITHWAASWIKQLSTEGITSGCGNGNYCPENIVTRAQMAVFLLKAEHTSGFTPPSASGTFFGDIPATYWASSWIEQLASEGITGGCGAGNYCPENIVTRAQMAVFLVRTFNLP